VVEEDIIRVVILREILRQLGFNLDSGGIEAGEYLRVVSPVGKNLPEKQGHLPLGISGIKDT